MPSQSELTAILRAPIKRRSGFEIPTCGNIPALRSGFFRRINAAMAGDAPKDFLRVYDFGRGRKAHPESWPAYIAKVGQKYYPNESVTEHLLTRIGQLMNLKMASSRLMWVRGQLRFLSEYFLREDESLVHGAEIFAGYLADKEFVQRVEEEDMERDIFTFQVVEEAIRSRFPDQCEAIMPDFIRLLGFDAVVGNNDRHFFNWGVITQVSGKRPPRFSPIYDTARAFYWNKDEEGLAKAEIQLEQSLSKYVRECYPKTGWDGLKSPNHFEMIQTIVEKRPQFRAVLSSLNTPDLPDRVEVLLAGEFKELFSSRRQKFIVSCLRRRLENYSNALAG